VDSRGNIYFTDVNTRTLWKLGPEGRLSAVVKDRWAHGLCVDELDRVWIEVEVDNTRYSISRIETDGTETTICEPTERGLDLYGVSLLADRGGNLYFPHSDPPRHFATGIRKRAPDGGTSLIAGGDEYEHRDGRGSEARFNGINSLCFGPDGAIYAVDVASIRRIALGGEVTTLFRELRDEDPEHQPFDNGNPNVSNRLYGLDVADDGTIYVAYHGNRRVLKLSKEKGREVIYRSEKPWSPVGVCLRDGDLLIKESGLEPGSEQPGPRIRRLKPDGTVETLVVVGGRDGVP
jgi:sugar lactone lactonase YvrE